MLVAAAGRRAQPRHSGPRAQPRPRGLSAALAMATGPESHVTAPRARPAARDRGPRAPRDPAGGAGRGQDGGVHRRDR